MSLKPDTKHIPEIRLASVFQWWIEDIEGAINDIKNGKLPEIQPLMSVKSSIESCAPLLVKQAAERDGLKESNAELKRFIDIFGWHKSGCYGESGHESRECSCGYDAAISELAGIATHQPTPNER